MRAIAGIVAVAALVCLQVSSVDAATRRWQGLGGTADWSVPLNWEGGFVPVNGDSVVFPAGAAGPATINNDLVGLSLLSISFERGYVLDGNPLVIGAGGLQTTSTAGSPVRFNFGLTVSGDQTWNVAGPGGIDMYAPLTLNGTLNLALAGSSLRMRSALATIGGPGGIVKSGIFPILYSVPVANAFAGTLTIDQGLVQAMTGALLLSDGTLATGTIVNPGGELVASGTHAEALRLNGDGARVLIRGGDFSGPVTISGGVLVSGSRFAGVVQGTGGLTIVQDTTLTLANPANSFVGGVQFRPGNLGDTTELVIQADEAVPAAQVYQMIQGAILTLDGHRQTALGLVGASNVFNRVHFQNAGAELRLIGDGDYTYAGQLTGTGIIRQTGTGAQHIRGHHPFNGTLAIEHGLVSLASGSIAGNATVTNDGTYAAGQGAAILGSLAATMQSTIALTQGGASTSGPLSLAAGTTFRVETSSTAGAPPGSIAAIGAVSLGGATLSLPWPLGFTAPVGTVFPIILNDGADPIVGTFAGLAEGAEITAGSTKVRISYVGNGNDVTLTVTESTRDYLLSEGASGGFFTTDILVANPGDAPVDAQLRFLRSDGQTVTLDRTLAAKSRITVTVNNVAGMEATEFSTLVRSLAGAPLIVERTMTWDSTGYGAHTEHAAEGAASQWHFAEGAQGFFFTYLLLANPNLTPNDATVTYLRENEPPVIRQYTVAPQARLTIDAGQDSELVGRAFGISVSFAQPGMAERAMYFGDTPLWKGGHESAGASSLSTNWILAEGSTGSFFTTFVLMANPNPTTANVAMTFLTPGGTPIVSNKTIGPNARLTVNIAFEDPSLANSAVATAIASSLPIVVERAQYWPGSFDQWYEAHNSFGMTAPATKWGLAEGRHGGPRVYQTYILLANAGTTDANTTITFLRETGAPVVKQFTVLAQSRLNVAVGPGLDVPELQNENFGALIESTQPISVERAMYSNTNGLLWSAGTNATAVIVP